MQTKAALWDSLIANKNTLMIQPLGSNCSYMQNDIPNMASLDKYCALESSLTPRPSHHPVFDHLQSKVGWLEGQGTRLVMKCKRLLKPRISIHLAASDTQPFRSRFCLAVLEELQKLQDKTTCNRHRWGPQNIPHILHVNNSKPQTQITGGRGLVQRYIHGY